MVSFEKRERLKAELLGEASFMSLLELACRLRDEGESQRDLFLLFSYFQQRLSPEDPRYDGLLDTMDYIVGGPWAKGGGIFDTILDNESVRVAPLQPPLSWVDVQADGDPALERQLAREAGPGHPLHGRAVRVLMRRRDTDEVLFAVRDAPDVAVVHLTWSAAPAPDGFPSTTFFASMLDWYEACEIEARSV
jgi:hypothetical protein